MRGEDHTSAKLTAIDVGRIRAGEWATDLAAAIDLNVEIITVQRARTGTSWRLHPAPVLRRSGLRANA